MRDIVWTMECVFPVPTRLNYLKIFNELNRTELKGLIFISSLQYSTYYKHGGTVGLSSFV